MPVYRSFGLHPTLPPPWGRGRARISSEDAAPASTSLRQYLDFPTDPTSKWGSLVQSGYTVAYALEIDGIPYILGEREMWTTRGVETPAPDYQRAMSYGLLIREGMAISVECDREKGLAAGRAVDFTVGRQQLADEALGAVLFARPTLRATITAAVTDPSEDTFAVDSTTGWPATGGLYIGREYCTYTSLTATSFGGVARGVAGMPHYHTASSASAYRQCTDTPIFWRGRLVTLWAHLVSPEGRYLGDRWCQLGGYARQEWRGYVRDAPRPSQDGITLTCLPLVRIAGMEIGCEAQGKMRADFIVSEAADTITVHNSGLKLEAFPTNPITTNNGIIKLDDWIRVVESNMATDYAASITRRSNGLEFRMTRPIAQTNLTSISGEAWFLDWVEVGAIDRYATGTRTGETYFLPFSYTAGPGNAAGSWIVVELEPSLEANDAVIGDTGLLALDIAGHTEVVFYDAKRTSSDLVKTAFRVIRRNMLNTTSATYDNGTTYFNPWLNDTTVRVIAGAAGPWDECLRTLLTSSGMGARGDYDTLPYGFGAGLPDDWITTSNEDSLVTDGPPVVAVSSKRTSIESLLCGWLALTRQCLVQRMQADGTLTLDVISTDIADNVDAVALGANDVMLDGHDTPDVIEAPNHIRIVASDAITDRPLHIIRDAARAQAEGVRAVEIKAPGCTAEMALRKGGEMLLLGDGQAAVKLQLPPWYEIQPGDQRTITTAHPALWDWATGTAAPTNVNAVVVAWERNLADQGQEVTFLLAGQSQERLLYAPTMVVQQAVSATVYRVDDSTGFAVGDEVLFYQVTHESTDNGTVTITAIAIGETYDVVTVDGDPVVDGQEIEITFSEYSLAVTRQRRFMYVRADKAFR